MLVNNFARSFALSWFAIQNQKNKTVIRRLCVLFFAERIIYVINIGEMEKNNSKIPIFNLLKKNCNFETFALAQQKTKIMYGRLLFALRIFYWGWIKFQRKSNAVFHNNFLFWAHLELCWKYFFMSILFLDIWAMLVSIVVPFAYSQYFLHHFSKMNW